MTTVPEDAHLLAIDIETASPRESPGKGDFQDTSYFELVAVGLGYQPGPDETIETEVLFRQGGWETEATSDLLQRVDSWCAKRKSDGVITYNGEYFDKQHLMEWGQDLTKTEVWPEAGPRIERLFSEHIDIMSLAVEHYEDRLNSWQTRINLEKVCEWEGIDIPETYYDDYDLGRLLKDPEIDSPSVTNVHIGEVLGEAYVDHLIEDRTESKRFRELERLLRHYTQADIEPLFHLSRRFTG